MPRCKPANVEPADQLLDRPALLRLTGLKSGTFGSIEHHGQGPAYILLGPRLKRYRRADVMAWLAARRVVPVGAKHRDVDVPVTEAR